MANANPLSPLVRLGNVSKHFGEGDTRVDALIDVSLDVHPGQVVGLLGPSGSGKTTLLNVVGCIQEPSGGWMELDGEVVYDRRWLRPDLRRLRLQKIGFIFQCHNLLPFLDSTENVAVALTLAGLEAVEAKRRAVELLDYLEVGHRRNAFPAVLSGGEAQRVAIARALAVNPAVMLMDEPLSALDSQTRELLMDDLVSLWVRQPFTAVYVTHNLHEAVRLGHSIVVLSRRPGRIREIVEIDTPLEERQMGDADLEAKQKYLWQLMRDEARAADAELLNV